MEDLEEPLAASPLPLKLCGRGVCISQAAGSSSHQAPSEHQSAPGLLNTSKPIHTHFTQDTPQVPPLATTVHQTSATLVPPTLISTTYQEG